MAPLLILMLLFVVACGRLAHAHLRIGDAAHSAARAASLARDPAAATRAATSAAHAALPIGASCTQADIAVDTSAFTPGGSVTVTVTCTVSLADLTSLSLPGGASTQSASFTSPIDTWRSIQGQP